MAIEITVKNFGPLKEAKVQLAPLTVFVGPNNTGKSYLATLIYAAMKARPSPAVVASRPVSADAADRFFLLAEHLAEGGGAHSEVHSSLKDVVARRSKNWFESLGRSFRSELERSFGANFVELAGGSSAAAVSIAGGSWSLRAQASAVTASCGVLRASTESLVLGAAARARHAGTSQDPAGRRVAVVRLIAEELFRDRPAWVHYLPASRSGILQTYRAFARAILEDAPGLDSEARQVTGTSGTVTDFVGQLLFTDAARSSPLAEIAAYLESELLQGTVRLEHANPMLIPEMVFEDRQGRFPVHRTSSMVSEVAPLVIWLRYSLRPDHLLVIEEPESHLHPAAQATMARAVAMMVNAGVKVLLTTHSDYFLAEINNLIREGSLPRNGHKPKARKSAKVVLEHRLRPEQVAAYAFEKSEGGTVVRDIAVTPLDGIDESEFGRVAEALHGRTVELYRGLVEAGVADAD